MNNTIRSSVVLAVVASLACVVGFAQSSGEAIYNQKCLNCHGPDGLANSGMGKAMKVKPVNDPGVKKFSEAEMIDLARNGMGKMQPYKDELSSAQIKASVDYFRTFIK
jgi:mono/diheme cytochrome c family protein